MSSAKFPLLLVLCPTALSLVLDKTTVQLCLGQMQNYLSCIKEEVRYHSQIVGAEVTDIYKEKVDDCFKNVGCKEVPTEQPLIETHFHGRELKAWTTFQRWIHAVDPTKRQCLIRVLGDSYRKTFVDCLNKFVPGIVARPLENKSPLPAQVLDLLNKRAYWRTLVSDSFKDCDRHEDAAACIIKLRRTEFRQSCAVRNHCAIIDDDAGFNDCFNSCFTVDESCQNILKTIRGEVCQCIIERRQQLVTVQQRHVNKTSPFGQKSAKVARILLFGEFPSDPIAQNIRSCNLHFPTIRPHFDISFELARYILLYIDGYTPRDIVYCHQCGEYHM